MSFDGLREQATALVSKYGPILTSAEPLTKELVFGLMLAVAIAREADKNLGDPTLVEVQLLTAIRHLSYDTGSGMMKLRSVRRPSPC